MDVDKILKYIVYIGLGVTVLVVPFLITGSMFFPFITGKNILFRVVVMIIAGAWAILALRLPEYRPKKSWILWGVLSLLVVTAVADIFGFNPTRSFWSNFERMDGYVTLLHLGLFILVASSFLKTKKSWNIILNLSVVASVLMGVYGLLQISGDLAATGIGANRIAGTFGNATYLAVYMLFNIFLILLLLAKHSGKSTVKWLYSLALLLQVFILVKTETRGAMLGLFGGLVLTALLVALFEKNQQSLRKFARNTLIALILLGSLFFVAKDTAVIQNVDSFKRLASISLDEGTVQSRILLWSTTAWNGFKERPILGWGQDGFTAVFAKYYNPQMLNQEPWFDRAHNIIFDWLITAGIFGLLAYLSLFVASLYYLWRPQSNISVVERSILTGLLAGYFFHSLFVFDNIMSYVLFGIVLSYIHFLSVYDKKDKEQRKKDIISTPGYKIAFAIIPIIVVIGIYVFSVRPALSARAMVDTLRQQPTLQDNLDLYDRALSYGPFVREDITLRLFQATGEIVVQPDIENEVKQAFVTRAIEEGERVSEESSGSARHELFFGVFLMRIGLLPESLSHLERAQELSPQKQLILNTLAQYYSAVGNIDEVLSFLRQAYEVAPEFEDPAIAYASGLIQVGNISEAETVLLQTFGTTLVPHPAIINAYIIQGDLITVRALWEKRVEENPEDASAHLSLASVLAELGYREEAQEEVDKALSINPDLTDSAQELIDSIGIE